MGITLAAVFFFAINVPVFSAMKQGDQAVADSKLQTALGKYQLAEEQAKIIDSKKGYFNIHAKKVEVNFVLVNMIMIDILLF